MAHGVAGPPCVNVADWMGEALDNVTETCVFAAEPPLFWTANVKVSGRPTWCAASVSSGAPSATERLLEPDGALMVNENGCDRLPPGRGGFEAAVMFSAAYVPGVAPLLVRVMFTGPAEAVIVTGGAWLLKAQLVFEGRPMQFSVTG